MRDRKSLILELIANPKTVPDVLQALSAYGWYCEEQLACLNKTDVLAVLKWFEQHQLSAEEVQVWAASIAGRTDISYEFGPDGVVEESLYWLAHPETYGPVSADLRRQIVALYERRQAKRESDSSIT